MRAERRFWCCVLCVVEGAGCRAAALTVRGGTRKIKPAPCVVFPIQIFRPCFDEKEAQNRSLGVYIKAASRGRRSSGRAGESRGVDRLTHWLSWLNNGRQRGGCQGIIPTIKFGRGPQAGSMDG